MLLAISDRIYTPRLSWAKAKTVELGNYASILSQTLQITQPPVNALLCTYRCCKDFNHHSEIAYYAEALTRACISAAESSITYTRERRSTPGRVPGWSELVKPFRQKSLFWHRMWLECDRPRNGVVADCMRRTHARYHYAVRRVKQNEELVVRERIANACIYR